MAYGKKTGGRDIKKGQILNPGGNVRTGTITRANDFKDWAFSLWKINQKELENTIMSEPKTQMDFLKMLATFVPKPVEVSGTGGEPITVQIVSYAGKQGPK